MLRPSNRTALGAVAIVAAALAVPAFADHGPTTKTSTGTQLQHCQGLNDNTVALTGPEVLWPPNHQFVNESATAHDGGNGQATLTITPSVLDIAGGDGGAQHDPDFQFGANGPMATGTPDATVPFQLRAERSGKGDGRTYQIDWMASFSDGTMCSSSDDGHAPFTVTVPHDMGHRS
jgi:hypothetical protein